MGVKRLMEFGGRGYGRAIGAAARHEHQLAPGARFPGVGIVDDPVTDGLVASLARPGGNITGITSSTGPEIEGKRMELLKEALPKIRSAALLRTMRDWENSNVPA